MSAILIVDDEPGMRQMLGRWLRPQGHAISEAADADEALVSIEVSPVEVVLCDVMMPGHDGLWLVAQLRRRFPQIAVVLATATETIAPSVSLQAGVVEFLVKPFDAARLVAAVGRAVEWHRTAAGRMSIADVDPVDAGDPVAKWLRQPPRSRPSAVDLVSDWLNKPPRRRTAGGG